MAAEMRPVRLANRRLSGEAIDFATQRPLSSFSGLRSARMRFGSRAYWLGLLVVGLLLSPTLASLVHRVRHEQGDFSEFREDGRIAIDTRRLGAHLPLSYPPTTRPLFMLMAMPPRVVAAAVWWGLSVWMYWQTAVWAARRWLPVAAGRTVAGALVVLATGLLGMVADLTVGQLTALVLYCIMAAFEFGERRRWTAAGALLAIPLLVKPLPIVIAPYFVLRRQWAVLANAAAVWLVAGPLLLFLIFGAANERDGWRHFRADTAGPRSPWQFFRDWESRPGGDETFRRSGLSSTLVRLLRPVTYDGLGGTVQMATLSAPAMAALWFIVIGGIGGWCCWAALRGGAQASGRVFTGFVCVMLLANPHFISYWIAAEMIPAAVLVGRCLSRSVTDRARRDRVVASMALAVWLASLVAFAFPVYRAAGSVVVGILALAVGVLLIRDEVSEQPVEPNVA